MVNGAFYFDYATKRIIINYLPQKYLQAIKPGPLRSKFSFDDSLSSYHTITYFLFIVLLSVIVYVVYTNKHRVSL